MGDHMSNPKYRELPPDISPENLVLGVDTRLTEAEHGTANPFDSPDPPLHVVGSG